MTPTAFDFVDVADYLDLTDANSRKRGEQAMKANPF